mgnify:CR=1 FL=1
MEILNLSLVLVILSAILITGLLTLILKSKSKNQLQKIFAFDLVCVLIISIGVISQEIGSKLFNINSLYFEKFIYIGTCFLPIGIYFTGLIFSKTKIKFKLRYILLCIVPIVTLCILWTNDYHHLFFKHYSTNMSEIITGPMHTINAIYSYTLLFLGVFFLLRYSIKNQGLFSKQSILILLGIIIPVVLNFLGTFKIIPMTVYVTPISFSLSMMFFTFAILKFQFLGATPIALQRIVDRISDSYLVLNDNGTITDFNKTFLTTFKYNDSEVRGKNLIATIKSENFDVDIEQLEKALKNTRNSTKTISFEKHMKKIGKTFTVEINTIYSNDSFLGTLILFKDITQHIEDMQKIKDTQESLMESERLSSLGQLIGGIAHNLKTPIMSIAGAAEGLSDLIKEYDSSIDDPEVNFQDHHDIAKDMSEWITKIRGYTEYMSDVITAVKGQAVTLSNEDDISFTIGELLKRVDILMKHELKNALVYLNISMKTNEDILIHGDVNNLVQVINNMISNAIQSYAGKPEQNIDLIVERKGNDLTISIKDYGCGIPKKVKDKLFKEMITTKGKNGTGLGLYMSYSTIKAHFNGNISLESEEGKGTTFTITIPL